MGLSYGIGSLLVGDYDATIRIASTNAINSPQVLTLKLHVIPPVCFWEPFDYYDGNLTLMGGANWSGTATNQLVMDGRVLEIIGGPGQVSASHPLACAGSNPGSGDTPFISQNLAAFHSLVTKLR